MPPSLAAWWLHTISGSGGSSSGHSISMLRPQVHIHAAATAAGINTPPSLLGVCLPPEAYNIVAVALALLLLCRGVVTLWHLYGALQLKACVQANRVVLIEGLGHRVQALRGLSKAHLEAIAHQCQVPIPRPVPRLRLPCSLLPCSLRLTDAGNGRVGAAFTLLLPPPSPATTAMADEGCEVQLFWGVDWPAAAAAATATNATTTLSQALTAHALASSAPQRVHINEGDGDNSSKGGSSSTMVPLSFGGSDGAVVEWARLASLLLASSSSAAIAAAAASSSHSRQSSLPRTIPLLLLLTTHHQPNDDETAHASLFFIGLNPLPASQNAPTAPAVSDSGGAAVSPAETTATGETASAASVGPMVLPRPTTLLHLCRAPDGRVFTAQEAFGLPTTTTATAGGGEEEDCIICLTEPKAAILLPCRHCCACERCLPFLTRCPVCRAPFHRYLLLEEHEEEGEGEDGAEAGVVGAR